MVRIFLGIFILFGISGGMDNMPPNPSVSYVLTVFTVFVIGLGLTLWGVKDIQK